MNGASLLRIFAILAVAAVSSSAATAPPRLQLDSASLSALQAHSGQKVVLIGYFREGFEVSALFPAEQRPEEIDYERAVWVRLTDLAQWKFLGFPFEGRLKIEGLLKAKPGERYGHLGGCVAELTDAKIDGLIPRNWWFMGITSAVIYSIFAVSKWSRGKRQQKRPATLR